MLDISFSFFLPIFFIIGRASVSAIVPVPKTTVYKNCDFLIEKHKIRVSFDFVTSSPTVYAVLLKIAY